MMTCTHVTFFTGLWRVQTSTWDVQALLLDSLDPVTGLFNFYFAIC